MCNHEYFQELSALAAIGQLSADEDHELNHHLLTCQSCRDMHRDYVQVIQHELPQADLIRWRLKRAAPSAGSDSEIRERFVARARAEGIEISSQAERTVRLRLRRPWGTWQLKSALVFAAAAVALISVTAFRRVSLSLPPSDSMVVKTDTAQLASENDALRGQIADLRKTLADETEKLDRLNHETSSSEEVRRTDQDRLQSLTAQVAALSSALQEAKSLNAALANTNQDLAAASQQKSASETDLRAQNDKLNRERADILNSRSMLEGQVRELNDALQQETSNLERERQLTAVSKDVRQLMGARSLHIMDVHDVGGGGKAAKAFGRVFYAEGQSLIFYAFDLPIGGLSPAKYTFQAWGQHETEPTNVRNLGTFEVDDHEQRRWVLKVDNPALLAGIESVFVTAESRGDTKEPRGKKLMYAYIVGQPNHP